MGLCVGRVLVVPYGGVPEALPSGVAGCDADTVHHSRTEHYGFAAIVAIAIGYHQSCEG